MADTAGENEADSGTSTSSGLVVDVQHELSDPTTSNNNNNVNSQDEDSEQNDNNVTGSTNYDSSDNTTTAATISVAATTTIIPTIVGTTTITTTHRCKRCDFEAVTQSALAQHINQIHNNNNNSNSNNNNSNSHNMNSNEVKMEVVDNNSPPDRSVHRKMFECDVCNMKFSNGANMRRHKMRHTGVKPYECRVCQKRFFRKDHLAEHFTTHTKTLPYHCPICNRGFQRQIAMRAHFQNEHVGQHDLVKSCPLCSYRAGSMKSLRVHFFNRHGIDLDNPGPAGSQASLFAAAAQQGFSMDSALTSLGNLTGSVSVSVTGGANYSDSGDSTGARSTDNATPPMHFLTPHVEISMADAPAPVFSPSHNERSNMPGQSGDSSQRMMNGECPGSPQSADSNSNAPSSSLIQSTNSLRIDQETNITPSISLIPIKQEPGDELYDITKRGSSNSSNNNNNNNNGPIHHSSTSPSGSCVQMQTATSSSLSSLIKVSPLKSLLRDDLKRKIVSRMNQSPRGGRSTSSPHPHPETSPSDTTTTTTTTTNTNTNGAITSTGPEQPSDSTLWRQISKRTLSSLQCIFCGIGFPDQTLYFLHKGCHSDANPWKCNICGEQCCNVYEFNSHLLSKSHQ